MCVRPGFIISLLEKGTAASKSVSHLEGAEVSTGNLIARHRAVNTYITPVQEKTVLFCLMSGNASQTPILCPIDLTERAGSCRRTQILPGVAP